MATLKDIRDMVQDWIEDDSESELVDRTINNQLRYLAKTEFEALRKSQDITPDSDGVIICPPAYQFCLGLYEQTKYGEMPSISFMPRTQRQTSSEPRTGRYLYHPYQSSAEDYASGTIFICPFGEDSVTDGASSLSEDMVGMEFVVDGDNSRYAITNVTSASSMNIFPSFRFNGAPPFTGRINKRGMRRYAITDPCGNAFTDTVTMDYQIDHPKLVSDDDELLIPMERTLSLMTVQQFLNQSKYDVDAQRLENSLFEARLNEYGTEPTNRQDGAPKDTMFSIRSKRRSGRRRR